MNEGWMQILTVVVANLSVVWWFRKESREDLKEIREDQKRLDDRWHENQNRWIDAVKSIELEMKSFHERLLQIEMERSKK